MSKLCPVCDGAMPKGYCTFGCSLEAFKPLENPLHVYRTITLCNVCKKEFRSKSSAHKFCSKDCSKIAKSEYRKNSPKPKYLKYAKPTTKVANLTPEEILINKEIDDREARYSRCQKIECKRCRYFFRTFDKNKEYCSKECEKIGISNKKKLEYVHTITKMPSKSCNKCKTQYKTVREDIGLCHDCRLKHIHLEKLEYMQEKPTKWAERKVSNNAKQKREINQKLEWAATERKDPVSKRLKVMRG